MTKEEIIAIYTEVSNKLCNGTEWCWAGVGEPLQLFAKLVAQHERNECLKICDEEALSAYWEGADACAYLIRKRGQK